MARLIPEPQKLAIMSDAVIYGEAEAARRHHVGRRTVVGWFETLGGLAQVRSYCAVVREAALARIEAVTARTALRRIPRFSDEHLLALMAQMIAAQQKAGSGLSINLSQQQLQAQEQVKDDDPDRIAAILGVLANAGLLSTPGSNGAEAEVLPAPADAEASGVPTVNE